MILVIYILQQNCPDGIKQILRVFFTEKLSKVLHFT